MKTTLNPYEVFNIPYNSSNEEIKKRYHALLFEYHPDKFHTCEDKERKAQLEEKYLHIQAAWDILSKEDNKHRFDIEFNASQQAHYDLSIDQFHPTEVEDSETILFSSTCRCGDVISFTDNAIPDEEDAIQTFIIKCDGCSLRYKINIEIDEE